MFARNTLLRKTCVPHIAPPQQFFVAVGPRGSVLITVHTGLARDNRFNICCHCQLTWSIEFTGLRWLCGKVEYRWVNSINTLSFRIAIVSASLTHILLTWRIEWAPSNSTKWQIGFNSAFKVLTWLFIPLACHMSTVAKYKKSVILDWHSHFLLQDTPLRIQGFETVLTSVQAR